VGKAKVRIKDIITRSLESSGTHDPGSVGTQTPIPELPMAYPALHLMGEQIDA
jgi:hypothetical protein